MKKEMAPEQQKTDHPAPKAASKGGKGASTRRKMSSNDRPGQKERSHKLPAMGEPKRGHLKKSYTTEGWWHTKIADPINKNIKRITTWGGESPTFQVLPLTNQKLQP